MSKRLSKPCEVGSFFVDSSGTFIWRENGELHRLGPQLIIRFEQFFLDDSNVQQWGQAVITISALIDGVVTLHQYNPVDSFSWIVGDLVCGNRRLNLGYDDSEFGRTALAQFIARELTAICASDFCMRAFVIARNISPVFTP